MEQSDNPKHTVSDSSDYPLPAIKRPRTDDLNDVVAFGKFKGVVPQQNGRWGAQIYANHQRIWLGTFRSETEAAMAYDSAAIKLRTRDNSHRNFPWTRHTVEEPNFQDKFSTDAVLNMIKDGSYAAKFAAFLTTQSRSSGQTLPTAVASGHFSCSHLFQKELTPSDVGKLNRLVIPKKYAVKYFPYISEIEEENDGGGGGVDDIELVFYDAAMRTWKFRYCYWKSSQSFVFTRGWNRFVKEKKLKAHDVIRFYRYENGEGLHLIDVIYKRGEDDSSCLVERCSNENVELQVELGKILRFEREEEEKECERKKVVLSGVALGEKRIRLFGVHID